MLNKKGFELAVNFLVVLIISVVVIGFGIKFVYDLVAQTSKLEQVSGEDLDARIGDLLCANEKQVCISGETKKVKQGDVGVFGVKILNVDSADHKYIVVLSRCQFLASGSSSLQDCTLTGANQQLITLPPVMTNPPPIAPGTGQKREITIKSKNEGSIALGVEVKKNAPSATYILNVDVFFEKPVAGAGGQYEDQYKYISTKKIRIEVP
ncbi:hypothetical protein HYX09_02925 [Candidatus Woesearchaeota archaeon]|nr:hypothetical protein [Candidatus Woesearchaeota archaeon]MBI2661200.1 hypothetical protein [Candidatus Woesearchaeota archaeon]